MKNTVLIVDDDEDIRDILFDLFESVEINCVKFSNVAEAKTFLAEPKNTLLVHSILSDLMMGQDSGLEFLEYIKSNSSLANIDFYLITGASMQTFDSYLNSKKLKGIIEKPFDSKKLTDTFLSLKSDSQKKFA